MDCGRAFLDKGSIYLSVLRSLGARYVMDTLDKQSSLIRLVWMDRVLKRGCVLEKVCPANTCIIMDPTPWRSMRRCGGTRHANSCRDEVLVVAPRIGLGKRAGPVLHHNSPYQTLSERPA
jgi:hypothetical protein